MFEWVRSFLESGEKLVIFANHKNIVHAIAKEFNALLIDGETPQNQRQEIVEKFQNDSEAKLIVMNMKTGGIGFTLTASSNVAFCELGWTPPDHDQAEDRCHRIGQRNSLNVWYLLANETIEEIIYQLIQAKRQTVNAVTEGKRTDESASVMEELTTNLITRG